MGISFCKEDKCYYISRGDLVLAKVYSGFGGVIYYSISAKNNPYIKRIVNALNNLKGVSNEKIKSVS